MNMNRTGALNRKAMRGIRQGFLAEQRLGHEIAVALELVDDQFVLPLDRQIDPRLAGMDVEMPRPEAVAAVRLDLSHVREEPVLESVDMQRTGVLRFAAFGIIAARDDDHAPVARRRPDLMEVDALVQVV